MALALRLEIPDPELAEFVAAECVIGEGSEDCTIAVPLSDFHAQYPKDRQPTS